MKNKKFPERKNIRKIILEIMNKENKWKRKKLIEEEVNNSGFNQEKLKDKGCESLSKKNKSISGTVLNELISEELIEQVDDNVFLSKPKKIDKNELTNFFIKKYLTPEEEKDSTPSGKKNIIKSVIGHIIKIKSNEALKAIDIFEFFDTEFKKNDATKFIVEENEVQYPNSPLGDKLKRINKRYYECKRGKIKKENYEKDLKVTVLECISLAGGEFFERLSMKLIKSYYGNRVIKDEVTGGSQDNGIDGKLFVKDELGFEEKIFFQAKTKRNIAANIPLCEIREFLGVMTADKINKGIMISNCRYHKDTIKFVKKVDNLILIGRDNIVKMLEEKGIGIIMVGNMLKIDEKIFLE